MYTIHVVSFIVSPSTADMSASARTACDATHLLVHGLAVHAVIPDGSSGRAGRIKRFPLGTTSKRVLVQCLLRAPYVMTPAVDCPDRVLALRYFLLSNSHRHAAPIASP